MTSRLVVAAATALIAAAPTQTIKRLPPVRALIRSRAWQRLRHRMLLTISERDDSTFTRFLRAPTQFEALAGPVLAWVGADSPDREPVRIVLVGSSTGAEPYSIASVLRRTRPDVRFELAAYDLRNEMVERARNATYSECDVFSNNPPADFVASTFIEREGNYVVQPSIAGCVSFGVADVMDPGLADRVGTADIVFAQNLLINFSRQKARAAFPNIARLLRPRSVLFADGMDIDLRARLTRDAGLVPLDYKIREIHEDVRTIRGDGWPWKYWGVESFAERPDWRQRYATVFLKGA
ncbi:MAG TPA: CheR family methyltransferase [Gemmatimonadaceae bacterium]|nr:CheR family methyltransferase [Gemmatimonadaceae bacterium]